MGSLGRDAPLEEVLVGGLERRRIVIVDYDPRWADRYGQERKRVGTALGSAALQIEHIGSTAVPGLAAKPIVDLLVIQDDAADEKATTAALAQAGYELRVREPGHLMFRTPARDVHVHVRQESDPEIARHLAFRERLRTSAADRDAYERLKRELATRDWPDMNAYADAKGCLIEEILRHAAEG